MRWHRHPPDGGDIKPPLRQDTRPYQPVLFAMSSRRIAALSLFTAATVAQAQAPATPPDFPADAQPLTAEALQQRLSGKVFSVKTAAGAPWRMQFQGSGFYFINVGAYSDNGKWRTDASRLCTEPQKRPAACNDMRSAGDALYLKRDSGEIVKFEPN
jgi:hypothetical protein